MGSDSPQLHHIQGEVLDIAVDTRDLSPSGGQSIAEILSSDNRKQLYIPEGFARGFLTLSDTSEFLVQDHRLSPFRE